MTLAAIAFTAAIMISGCPAQLEDRDRFLACGDVPQTIFAKSCVSAGCHNSIDLAGALDLESADVAARVAFVQSPNCDELLADPTKPSESLIYKKTAHTTSCGDPMPLDDEPLSPRQLWCIREWITGVGSQRDAATEASGDAAGDAAAASDGSGVSD